MLSLEGLVLMGPFGSDKSYFGTLLASLGIARYEEMEPLIYDRFEVEGEFRVEDASQFIRTYYLDELSKGDGVVAFESTGVTQRPLLLEILGRYRVALVRLVAPKEVCLARVRNRNLKSDRPIDLEKAAEFYEYWTSEVEPRYDFALEVDSTNQEDTIREIQLLIEHGYA